MTSLKQFPHLLNELNTLQEQGCIRIHSTSKFYVSMIMLDNLESKYR